MTDQIRIENLKIFAHHGVHPEENRLGQQFIVSVCMELSTAKAGREDDLTASVSYSDAARMIAVWVQEENFQLIEAVAEKVACRLLAQWPAVRAVTVEVKKPWAPVGLPLDWVSVRIHREWKRAFVGLGSNMGDTEGYLNLGVEELRANPHIRVKAVSQYRSTKPWGNVEQDDFLNACAEIETTLDPLALLEVLQAAEQKAGRVRLVHWGPRTLDMDLLFYDNLVLDSARLVLPHPEAENRLFVMEPMAELAPFYRHPVTGRTMKDYWYRLKKEGGSETYVGFEGDSRTD